MKDKYYVDIRVGCVAVRENVDYKISPGCHEDLPDVIAYWPGIIIHDENDISGRRWIVEDWKIEKAKKLCQLLN